MPLTSAQLTTLKAAILTETDPTFVTWRNAGAHGAMSEFYNVTATPVERAWRSSVTAQELDEGSSITSFDALSAGKRDAWMLFLEYAPRDFTKNKVRAVITDVWGASTATNTVAYGIYNTVATRDISRGEKLLGGLTTQSEGSGAGTVTAKKLAWEGRITSDDIYNALMVA